jgi:outer membrane translocation and assembly module TamA
VSVFYQYIKERQRGGHLLSDITLPDLSVFNGKSFGGIEGSYHFRKVNNTIFPTAGIDFLLAADYLQNLKETSRSFSNVASAAAFYIPVGRSFSIASRAGGATLTGDADFYHLNKLGGFVNLRGYARERFYGKTIFYNNNELRWLTSAKNYFFDGQVGLLAFYDEGRVWQPLERSNQWHTGYGAGVIVIAFNKIALNGTYCISKEGHFIQLKAGMLF